MGPPRIRISSFLSCSILLLLLKSLSLSQSVRISPLYCYLNLCGLVAFPLAATCLVASSKSLLPYLKSGYAPYRDAPLIALVVVSKGNRYIPFLTSE